MIKSSELPAIERNHSAHRRDPEVSDMVPPRMVQTPWGDSSQLREKTLPPDGGRLQRKRSRTTVNASTGRWWRTWRSRAYQVTTIADLVEVSGVSRSAFYRHFNDKQECFLAAIEALVMPAVEAMSEGLLPKGEPPNDAAATQERAFEGLLRRVAIAAAGSDDVHCGGLRGRDRGGGSARPGNRSLEA